MRWITIALLSLTVAMPAQAKITVSADSAPRGAIVHGTVQIDAPLPTVLEALQKACAVRQWLPNVQELRVVARPSSTRTKVYMRQNLPWPWHARDVVSLFERKGDARDDRVDISQRNIDGVLASQHNVVRMPWLRAHWTLQRDAGATEVRYRQQLQMGGHLPQALTDRAARSLVDESLRALRKYAEHDPSPDCEHNDSDAAHR